MFILGGCDPTSLRYKHIESDNNSNVYVLNMLTMKWEQPSARNSHEHLREPQRIAEADVIRALKRCDEEKLRGLSLGNI